jgi:hypothetical protein
MKEIHCNEMIEKFTNSISGTVMVRQKNKDKVSDIPEIQLIIPNNEEIFVCKNTVWNYEFYQNCVR